MNIIAYGSLMNKTSLEKTLKRPAELYKIVIPGYSRIFNAPFGSYSFLNLLADPKATIEGAYFTLRESEIKLFADREAGSNLVEILPNYYAFIWPTDYCKTLPVLRSYLSACQKGAQDLGVNFKTGLRAPDEIVDDSAEPLYV